MSRTLVINADDLGLCRAVNVAVVEAHRHGILTSASLMATGPAFDHAVETVVRRNPALGIGAHLCLTSGASLLGHAEIPRLVHQDGTFRHGFVSLMRLVHRGGQDVCHEIERELDAQLAKLQSAGIAIDHVNSHRHVHMIPAIFGIVDRLAVRYGKLPIRVSAEPWFPQSRRMLTTQLPRLLSNAPKNLILRKLDRLREQGRQIPCADRVYGILGSGRMDCQALSSTIRRLPEGVSEILTHPAADVDEPLPQISPSDRAFITSNDRQREREALTHPACRTAVNTAHVELISFRDLSTQQFVPHGKQQFVNN
ncbi:MAG: carbohydrate deacetylase [Planctomycetaceae bacterium]